MLYLAITVFVILFADVYFRLRGIVKVLQQSYKRLWDRTDHLEKELRDLQKNLRNFKNQFNLNTEDIEE